MSYLYTEEQSQIRDEVRKVLTGSAGPEKARSALEQGSGADAGFWTSAGEMGWTGITVAEDAGGLGMGIVDAMIVAEEAGRALAPGPFLATGFAAAHVLGQALGGSGSHDDVLARWLADIATGAVRCAIGFAEGTQILPASPAIACRDGRLTGYKSAALGGASADIALVHAQSGGSTVLALVRLDGAGVQRRDLTTLDDSRATADLDFDGADAIVLNLADPAATAVECLERLALHLASEAVGGTDVCIAMASEFANQRQAFGQAIGKFQAVKHAISEMYVANELARASVLDAAARLSADAPAGGAHMTSAHIAAARLNAVHSYEYATAAATQIHGGIGVTWEADLHLHYRRSRCLAAEAGPPAFWEDRIVASLEQTA